MGTAWSLDTKRHISTEYTKYCFKMPFVVVFGVGLLVLFLEEEGLFNLKQKFNLLTEMTIQRKKDVLLGEERGDTSQACKVSAGISGWLLF